MQFFVQVALRQLLYRIFGKGVFPTARARGLEAKNGAPIEHTFAQEPDGHEHTFECAARAMSHART